MHGVAHGVEESLSDEDVTELLDELVGVPRAMPLVAPLATVVVDALTVGIAVFGAEAVDERLKEGIERGGGGVTAEVASRLGLLSGTDDGFKGVVVDTLGAYVLAGERPALLGLLEHLLLREPHMGKATCLRPRFAPAQIRLVARSIPLPAPGAPVRVDLADRRAPCRPCLALGLH